MNALFVHDHTFRYCDSKFYSSGGLPSGIWSRYLSVFDSLTVVGRDGGEVSEPSKGHTISSIHGVSFELLDNISNFKSLLLGNSAVTRSCRSLVSKHNAVIARLPSRLGSLFIREAIKQGKPYAVEVVGCPLDALWNYGSWKARALAPLAAISLKNIVAKAPFALYVTEWFLQKRYPCVNGKTAFCSNVEIAAVDCLVLEERLSKIKNFNSEIKFGLIGNYSSNYKGIDVAVKALALVNDELPSWKLEVLGLGDATRYQELAHKLGVGDKVFFIGALPSGQPVFEWLDTIDFYLQPSLTEGLPRALAEAMSRGCPAAGSSVGGMPELLSNEQLFSGGDYVGLAHLINDATKNYELLAKQSKQNFIKAKSYYISNLNERRTEFWFEFSEYVSAINSQYA
jgi:glycosyltransferase involved in cell wall biosynthesis